ncbi:hypothetical protein PAPYR_12535 [Paratrimastix pyriformis]|uniref:Uncharacterized protein n=1 Tax=Paratrimastix pyriformis TaxID=342808 RepID=A0ABQ8U6Y5_9EUKA|nr:hypothetical protein PAPYR_12535 [Paratrimastix pyriformis]
MGMEPTGLGSPDEPEVSSGATSVSRGLFLPSQEPLAPALPSHSKEPEDHPPSPGTRGEDIETLLEPNAPDDVLDDILWQVPADWYCSGHRPLATPEPPPSPQRRIPAGVTNDDGQSCAYAATVPGRPSPSRPGPVEASLRGTPSSEVIGAAVAAAAHPSTTTAVDIRPVVTAVSRDMPHIRGPAGRLRGRLGTHARGALRRKEARLVPSLPGPLRVDKCSCGGQLRELSAVKPAPVLVVTVDKLAGVIARAFKTGRLEREGWPSFRLAAPGQQLRRPPHPVSRPSGTAHPGYSTHLSSTIGPDSTGRPREQLLAPPVDRPASPADVSPSPSDQATTNTPEEEHQDHTGAPLNHNRPRSSEDFVIFYPGAARRWTRGPSPSLSGAAGVDVGVLREPRRSRIGDADGHPEGDVGQVNCRAPRHSRGGPPSPTHTRHANRGHRPAGHRPRGPFELYFPDGAPDGLTPAPTAVRTSREGQAWAVFSSLEDATAARAGASTRVAWSKATAARLNLPPEATSPRLPQAPSTVEALQPLRNARARTVRPIRPGMRGPASTLPPTNAMGYPPETVFILPNSMPMAQLTLADGRPFRH